MNKNKIWTKGHEIKEFKVFPDDRGGDFVEMAPQLSYVKYYEDVVDPSIHVDISVTDALGLINKLPVRSGSGVKLKYEHPSGDPVELDLVITNITGHVIDHKKEIYTLTCEREGALSNHTTRVTQKYTGAIHESVKKILSIIDKDLFKMDTATNECRFFGNYKRPFMCIAELCRKSIPEVVGSGSPSTGSAGFLFYETLDGYNFRSIDQIFEEGKPSKGQEPPYEIFEYSMTPFKSGLDPGNNFKLASEPNFRESHDIIRKLRLGSYSTNNWYYDVITRKVHFHNFRYNNGVKANDEEVSPSDYKNPASRIILGALDTGTTSVDADGKGTDAPQDQARLQAQSAARYSALFSQSLDITVPMNLSLRVGTLVSVKFPNLNIDRSIAKNSPESGNYMIARLSHELGNPSGDFTGLTLVRDSFTIEE